MNKRHEYTQPAQHTDQLFLEKQQIGGILNACIKAPASTKAVNNEQE